MVLLIFSILLNFIAIQALTSGLTDLPQLVVPLFKLEFPPSRALQSLVLEV